MDENVLHGLLEVKDRQIARDGLGPSADLQICVLYAVGHGDLFDIGDILDVALLVGNFEAGLHLLGHHPEGQEAKPCEAAGQAAKGRCDAMGDYCEC